MMSEYYNLKGDISTLCTYAACSPQDKTTSSTNETYVCTDATAALFRLMYSGIPTARVLGMLWAGSGACSKGQTHL